MIISKTPLRISFAGGGTDLRSYYKNNKYGAVLSTSIDSYIYVSIKKFSILRMRFILRDIGRAKDIFLILRPL